MTTGFAMPTPIVSIIRNKLALHTEIIEVKNPFVLSKKRCAKNTMNLNTTFFLYLQYGCICIL